MQKNIVLVGLSGTGKSTVGALLAQALGWNYLDTDALIESEAGRPISAIFAGSGELAFRQLESAALRRALAGKQAVIATGGGIIERVANREALRDAMVVWLTANPKTLAQRLAAHKDRPLLQSSPLSTLESQMDRRAGRYATLARWIVTTDQMSPAEVVREIRRHLDRGQAQASGALTVETPGGSYEVIIAAGALDTLPERLARLAPRGRFWIVSDDQVWPLHGARLTGLLDGAGIEHQSFQFPAGESSKQLPVVAGVYDWLLAGGVERGDTLVALGGGVVGDLAGFVASTVLRGIGLVHLPTTILSIVDSSIGGKTGVDHAAGKNLIGTFYQPQLVLADTTLLQTLPLAERQAGCAEAIKHGVIADAALFEDLVANEARLRELEEPITGELLRRAAAVKVRVVSGDEREHGDRILLNYGHTIGHALERWSNYAIGHGVAVAMGMGVAAAIGRRVGVCHAELEQRQQAALQAFGLPTHLPATVEPEALLEATRGDKKMQDKRQRWVLASAIGAATVRDDIDEQVVLDAIRERREA